MRTNEALTRDQIRAIFMRHGFTVKEGNADLKPYVYEAAEALIAAALASAPPAAEPVQPSREFLVPDPVWEALQRMIEDGVRRGPASREDAKAVADWRGRFWKQASDRTDDAVRFAQKCDALRSALALAGKMSDAARSLVGGQSITIGRHAPASIYDLSARAVALQDAVDAYDAAVIDMTRKQP